MKQEWIPMIKGEIEWETFDGEDVLTDDSSSELEFSIVRTSNKHGRNSWGWADEDKLIICGNGLNPGTRVQVEFAKKAINVIANALNKAKL